MNSARIILALSSLAMLVAPGFEPRRPTLAPARPPPPDDPTLITTATARLTNMGDPNHYMRHSLTEWRVSKLPRVTPPPEGKGRRKGTRAQRRARP